MKQSRLFGEIRGAVVLLAITLLLTPPVFAQQEQVLELRQKVIQLEERIKELERVLDECMASRKKGTTDELGWQNKMNWRKLEIGMSETQVRDILGEPTKVIEGVKTLWYYPNIYGGFVSFDKKGHVAAWNEP